MSFEISGKLVRKFDIESKTSSFQTREFVIEIQSGNYPEFVKFQTTQERCNIVDNYNEGDTIKVHFDLRGREWQGKYFTNLNAWRVEADSEGSSAAAPAAKKSSAKSPAAAGNFPNASDEPATADAPTGNDYNDDLPF